MSDQRDDSPRQGRVAPEVIRSLVERSTHCYLKLVQDVLIEEHDILVAEVARRFGGGVWADSGASAALVPPHQGWVEIESLSRLRSIVGGRFQNLRDRWVGAGFPLREHRGDKDGAFVLNEAGWIELSNWIAKQGFESRLTPDKSGCLFELRALSRAG